jgi:antitoxin component YwqK of YwqJK toxin-antitoxin module
MKIFSTIILFNCLSILGIAQQAPSLTSLVPKYASQDETHRNKIDDNGNKWGKWKYFSRSGEIVLEITFENNKKNGKYARYNGVTGKIIEQGNYLNGVKNGKYTKWFSNGVKRVEGTYSKGMKNSIWNYYFKNGTGALRISGKFSDGKKNGNWIFYDKNGNIRKKINFQTETSVKENNKTLPTN